MSLVGLSNDQIELIGQELAARNDYACTSAGDILHVTFDCGAFRIDKKFPSKEYARPGGAPPLSKTGLHVASLDADVRASAANTIGN